MAPLRGPKAPHGRPKDSLADPVLGAVMSFRGSRGSLEEAHGGSLTLSLPPLEGLSASAGPRGLEVLDVPALPALLSEPPVGVGAPGEGPQEEAAEEELNEDERSQHEGGFPHQIIPGLPDELGFECLLRVHRGDHRSASEVSAEWHSAIRVRAWPSWRTPGVPRRAVLKAPCQGPLPLRLKAMLLRPRGVVCPFLTGEGPRSITTFRSFRCALTVAPSPWGLFQALFGVPVVVRCLL